MGKKLLYFFSVAMLVGLLTSVVHAQQPAAGPDFSKAAEALGVTTTELTTAIGGPPPDFAGAAEKFGISIEELIALLPAPPASDIPEGFTAEDFMQQ